MEAIARLTGVAQVTVSRAINHPTMVSPETLKRINDAVRLTGYVPNLVAGALASRRSRLIAALVPSITNIVYAEMIQGFLGLMREAGYQVLLGETGHSREEEEALVQAVLSRRPDGIVLTGIHHTTNCRRMLLAADIPVVELWDVSETPIDICVGFSHAETGVAVARYLQSQDQAKMAFVTVDDERALSRKDAFCRTIVEAGGDMPEVVLLEGTASVGLGRVGLSRLVERGFASGAVACSSDLLAHGVLIEAQSRGIAVPETLSVVGFGDQTFAAETYPALTTVRVDRSSLGATAAEAMLARLKGETVDRRKFDVGFSIVPRGTTRPRA